MSFANRDARRSAFELRVIDKDGNVAPRDGVTSGALQIRGPWVIKRYFKAEADCVDADQWFDTGDVSVLHPDGTMQITDRVKDVIKSGGEWISSVELENIAVGCPGIAEAGAIGIAHPKWDERPVLIAVKKPGADVDEEAVKAYLAERIVKWWMPDRVLFVDELPHTGTGKIQKVALRAAIQGFRAGRLKQRHLPIQIGRHEQVAAHIPFRAVEAMLCAPRSSSACG